ncbi:MAG: NFYB/HAP3 family transcription factor subunit, partial [Candidatus Anstonellales archaeon]
KVSEKGLILLKKFAEKQIIAITKETVKLAKLAKRKTIIENDIKFYQELANISINKADKPLLHEHSIRLLIKKAISNKLRIGKNVSSLIGIIIENRIMNIVKLASKLTKHANRKIIKEKDIQFAMKSLFKSN